MARPLRPQLAGAWYHIGARGVRKLPIVCSDDDCLLFLSVLAEVVQLKGWRLIAFCLMTNHYHLVLQTPEPNIAAGMQRLNTVYAHAYNRLHGFSGHLFDARYWSGVIETDGYLLESARYVVLNPVRAALRARPSEWEWSSYSQTVGLDDPAPYLDLTWLRMFDPDLTRARALYRGFVYEGLERLPRAEP